MILYLDKLSAMLQLIFFLLKLSLAAPKIATYRKKRDIGRELLECSKGPPSCATHLLCSTF